MKGVIPMLDRWSRLLVRRPLAVLLAGLALALAAGAYGAGVFGSLSQGGFDDPESESAQALEPRSGRRSATTGVDVVAIYSSDELRGARPRVPAARRGRRSPAIPDGTTTEVVTWYDTRSPGLVSDDGHSTQVLISLEGETQDDVPRQLRGDRAGPARRGARHRPRRHVRGLRRRQRAHRAGPAPGRDDLAARRRILRRADLRQPRRRLDAGARRRARRGRCAGGRSGC